MKAALLFLLADATADAATDAATDAADDARAAARARAAYAAANREAVEALRDAMGGLRYIESEHGRLYGVGWDRVYAKADAAYAAYEAARKT